jgi:hypothetical protein
MREESGAAAMRRRFSSGSGPPQSLIFERVTEPDDLVLEHLRAIRSDLARQRDVLGEHTVRLNEIAVAVAGPRRDQALDAEAGAHLAARIDRLRDGVERIKRGLDLTDE